MNRIANSWRLFKSSLQVLLADKELVIFPILSAIGVIVVTLTFALPFLLSNLVDRLFLGSQVEILGLVIAFLFYIVQYTVIFFANTALVGAALIRLRGGDPTISDGFRIAASRLGPILGYALIAATVGMILRALSQRGRGLGRLVVSIIGFAWNIATYLVVPVLAVENIGPIEAIKRSTQLLKRTWGEQIVGNLGLGAVFIFVYIAEVLVLIPFFLLGLQLQSAALIIGVIAVLILLLMLTGLIQSTLEGIYAAAVYQYATTGQASGFFDENLVRNAFQPSLSTRYSI